ncbi:MAG: inositol monophosphatase family protein [Candidatus Omnitrophota bacterium]
MTTDNQFSQIILDLAAEAGRLALKYQGRADPSLKKDGSVVTKADIAVSKLCRKRLSKFLKTKDHLLIEEEDPHISCLVDQSLFERTPYVWAIDPIDGTQAYANGMPNYGISIGLLKDCKPFMGAVYLPAFGELFFHDGVKATFVKNAFTKNEKRKTIQPAKAKVSPQSFMLCEETFLKKFNWDFKDIHLLISASAVVDLCWPAIGRGFGCIFKAQLWDFAASWPIFRAAGLDLRSLRTGKVLNSLCADLFIGPKRPFRLKEYYVLSSQRNFAFIQEKIKGINPHLRKENDEFRSTQ